MKYLAIRFMSRLMTFLGFAVFAVAVLVLLYSLNHGSVYAVAIALTSAIFGIAITANGQLLKLAVNVAGDMSRVATATESAAQRNLLAAQ